MTAQTLFLVALGGSIGALLRFLIAHLWPPNPRALPYPTLFVNILGSALLGLLLAPTLSAPPPIILFAGLGFCGAFTTFSTFTVETAQIAKTSLKKAALYVALTTAGSIASFAFTYTL